MCSDTCYTYISLHWNSYAIYYFLIINIKQHSMFSIRSRNIKNITFPGIVAKDMHAVASANVLSNKLQVWPYVNVTPVVCQRVGQTKKALEVIASLRYIWKELKKQQCISSESKKCKYTPTQFTRIYQRQQNDQERLFKLYFLLLMLAIFRLRKFLLTILIVQPL